jgi:hypothetical protein
MKAITSKIEKKPKVNFAISNLETRKIINKKLVVDRESKLEGEKVD